ncbi:MAG: hypothetical protein LBT97_01640, partial [Planctomycetota bacterium]|nr:hypothetical protein [Planctomycetota bacterium]
ASSSGFSEKNALMHLNDRNTESAGFALTAMNRGQVLVVSPLPTQWWRGNWWRVSPSAVPLAFTRS